MKQTTQKAYAKINMGLDVLRRRPDGYHEVKMIMQTVDICDELLLERLTEPGIFLYTDNEELPPGQDNLIYRAANLLMREKAITEGVKITLTKRIPIAAGMAGGSSDAAATMRGMNELFEMNYSPKELQRLGVTLGADIPYCLVGGTMLSEGIGEILSPLPSPPSCYLVIAKPEISVSTKYVYENLHAERLTNHPDIDGISEALAKGDLYGMTKRLGNVLETVTAERYPVIETIKQIMRGGGAENALMSGSGPTVFGIFTEEKYAKQTAKKLEAEKYARQVFITTWKTV